MAKKKEEIKKSFITEGHAQVPKVQTATGWLRAKVRHTATKKSKCA